MQNYVNAWNDSCDRCKIRCFHAIFYEGDLDCLLVLFVSYQKDMK